MKGQMRPGDRQENAGTQNITHGKAEEHARYHTWED